MLSLDQLLKYLWVCQELQAYRDMQESTSQRLVEKDSLQISEVCRRLVLAEPIFPDHFKCLGLHGGPGHVRIDWDRRDTAIGMICSRGLVEEVNLSSVFEPPSPTYPFLSF